ncbi:hypothetical protein HZ326_0937 [Fusarium oxysporum f. sp. albedinis]|nr:hypothetical protein HZ326_0937 [Fusarium oxysporum f. sp. albedinis]
MHCGPCLFVCCISDPRWISPVCPTSTTQICVPERAMHQSSVFQIYSLTRFPTYEVHRKVTCLSCMASLFSWLPSSIQRYTSAT